MVAGEGLPEHLRPLVASFREGRRIGLARAISVVEDERPGFQAFLHEVLAGGMEAARVGMTGPPGAGKSSLVAAMATIYRQREERVGVVAVDPTSPYSGGALLGDRIRMNDLATDPGIFIRSMATRGSLGGLATTTKEVIDLMDAFGFHRILVETVGVGQSELEVTGAADTVVVVLVPESGDAIQAMKAGLMEIADIFVVNKADRPGADRLAKEIRQSIHLRGGGRGPSDPGAGHHGVDLSVMARKEAPTAGAPGDEDGDGGSDGGERSGAAAGAGSGDAGRDGGRAGGERPGEGEGPASEADDADSGDGSAADGRRKKSRRWVPPEGWQIPVLKTTAQVGEGVDELLDAVARHREHLAASGELEQRRRARTERRVRDVVERELRRVAWRDPEARRILEGGLEGILRGEGTPYSLARRILESLLRARMDRLPDT